MLKDFSELVDYKEFYFYSDILKEKDYLSLSLILFLMLLLEGGGDKISCILA